MCNPSIASDCGVMDKEMDELGNDANPIVASTIFIIGTVGTVFDVQKSTVEFFKPLNTAFTFVMSYANLGEENFSAGSGLDILPYNGDGQMT